MAFICKRGLEDKDWSTLHLGQLSGGTEKLSLPEVEQGRFRADVSEAMHPTVVKMEGLKRKNQKEKGHQFFLAAMALPAVGDDTARQREYGYTFHERLQSLSL